MYNVYVSMVSHFADEWSSARVYWHVSGQVVVRIELFAALGTYKRFRRRFVVITRLVFASCRRCRRRRGTGRLDCGRSRFHLEQGLDERSATLPGPDNRVRQTADR